ncbi:hypothetical protein ASPZODRAFT_1104451 [Penicilliopsis zonata CBS 506.65]|uniref:Uncharacterized protein n=1 Tax=Penicilliopsis zonata CBS 506.65 TaxID=1073090 RepID=A0A1L9SSB3_9EURO|nr:hypothetical protein ASPZODRAFT_1104451 [Penicilliopsis zonata CBS 506.65]OJJ50102.1 hypothetical protein ASPZODRAFT_1104451 [Penicilliopsis zonata CBS 506.65]
MFSLLYEWDQAYWHDPRAFIRSLTFNALDLTHTCFSNTKKGCVITRNQHPDDEYYINEDCDQQSSLDGFEKLLAELEQKFDELRLPLQEFVTGHWYRRVKDYLLTPQNRDEQHIRDARDIGVVLEFHGLFVPDWIENWIAPKVEEVNDSKDENHTI